MDIVNAFTNESIDQIRKPRGLNTITIGHKNYGFGTVIITERRGLGRIVLAFIGLGRYGVVLAASGGLAVCEDLFKIGDQPRWQKVVLQRRSRHFQRGNKGGKKKKEVESDENDDDDEERGTYRGVD